MRMMRMSQLAGRAFVHSYILNPLIALLLLPLCRGENFNGFFFFLSFTTYLNQILSGQGYRRGKACSIACLLAKQVVLFLLILPTQQQNQKSFSLLAYYYYCVYTSRHSILLLLLAGNKWQNWSENKNVKCRRHDDECLKICRTRGEDIDTRKWGS